MLKIGVSACFFHEDPERPIFKGKALIYMEQSMAHWLMSEKVFPVMIPSAQAELSLADLAGELDGILFQGGSDLSPKSYGSQPLKPEWAGDYIRDQYEITLFNEFLKQNKPILGICRGAQLMNVALGGTLYQDIQTQKKDTLVHRDWNIYDQLFHEINIVSNTQLSKLYKGISRTKVNSVHHQGIDILGKDLVVEATSTEDGIIEAIRYLPSGSEPKKSPYAFAVQWHPEFQDPKDKSLLDTKPLLREFIDAVKQRKNT